MEDGPIINFRKKIKVILNGLYWISDILQTSNFEPTLFKLVSWCSTFKLFSKPSWRKTALHLT